MLYELGERVRRKLPGHKVVAVYIGKVQDRRDKKTSESDDLLRQLRSLHDGRQNLFLEDYLPEDVLPFAFKSLDVSVFWCKNATQSGRMAHAQGSGTCVVGRRIEGIGETLDLAGLPSGVGLGDMADKIAALILDPALRVQAERSSQEYAKRYSFENQANKHLLLSEAVAGGRELPALDRARPDISFILPKLAVASSSGLEGAEDPHLAFLNVADDSDLFPRPRDYHRISLKDGVAIPPESMRAAVEWITTRILHQKVVIFCRYGRGRSASIAIGYLCSLGMAYSDAVEAVRVKRYGTAPLPGLARTIELACKAIQATPI